jgi:hypothetical protein
MVMRELIRKILREDLENSYVSDASPERDKYEMSEQEEIDDSIDENLKKVLFNYWDENGTDGGYNMYKYFGLTPGPYGDEELINKLKNEYYGGVDKAFELALNDITFYQPMRIVDGGYDFIFTPIITKPREVVGNTQYGTYGVITKGHVYLSDIDVTHDFKDIFGSSNRFNPDIKDEISFEVRGAINEKFADIFDKYGLLHNYVSYEFSPPLGL